MRADSGPSRLCVVSAKGGTGKTTVAINVAGALSQRGHDVLFVDLDPQGYATEGLGLRSVYDAPPPTLFDALVHPRWRSTVGELVVEHAEMDVLPSNVDMLGVESELTVADATARLHSEGTQAALESLASISAEQAGRSHTLDVVSRTLAPIEAAYDYVVIDCPPSFGTLTEAAIYAARNVLVPALAEVTTERAIERLMDQLATLERHAEVDVETVGVVANRVGQTTDDAATVAWLEEVYPDTPLWKLRERVALQRAFAAGESVFRQESASDVVGVFEAIAAHIDGQLDRQEVPA